ncbi:hypothetical protein HYQ46_008297 [Verticillium longisporum]|nr:hypothetical protein HYQ46_008297 [Verticillium longisporum]
MSRKPMTRFDRIPEDDGPCLLSTSWQFGILADGYRGARWRLLASVVASRRRSETGFTPGAEGTKDRIAFRRSKHVGDAYFNSTKDTAASGRATAPQSGPSYQKQQA